MAAHALLFAALISLIISLFAVIVFHSSSPTPDSLGCQAIMIHYPPAGGTVPSFRHTPIWREYNPRTCATKRAHGARNYQRTSMTPRRTFARVPAAGSVMQSPHKSGSRSIWRKLLGISKQSKTKTLSSRSKRTRDAHACTPGSSPIEPCPEALARAHGDVRKREARALVCKTRVLESILLLPQVTYGPESDDDEQLPPEYAIFDPYPIYGIGPGNRDQPTVWTSSAKRKKGLRFMSKKAGKGVRKAVKYMSAAAQSAQIK